MMPRPELDTLLAELRRLSDREFRFTLSGLSAGEHAQVLELLESSPVQSPSFEMLAGISPWLMKRIEAARRAEVQVDGREVMTKASCDALLGAFASLGDKSPDRPIGKASVRTPSFMDRFLKRPARGVAA